LESLACETPIIVTMTGGLQEQVTVTDKVTQEVMEERNKTADSVTLYEHGIGIEPSSKSVIGSQEVPYIYEDRLAKEDFLAAMKMFYDLSSAEKQQLGATGRAHVENNYNFDNYVKQWDELFIAVHENCGSWETRKNYKTYEFKEIT